MLRTGEKREAGSGKQEAGSWKLEVGSRKSEVGSLELEVGSRKSEDRSQKQGVWGFLLPNQLTVSGLKTEECTNEAVDCGLKYV